MSRYRHNQIFFTFACLVIVRCVADLRLLLIGNLFKLVVSLLLACLLAFVVVDSANIWRLLAAFLSGLTTDFFPWSVARRWTQPSQTTIAVSSEPSLSPLFQRPPPALSL
jgi:hypothetical protein